MTDKEKIYMDVCDPADKECVSYALSDVTFTGYFYPGSNPASMCKIRLSWCDDIMQTPIVSSVEILRDTDVWETITDDVEHDYLLDNLWPWLRLVLIRARLSIDRFSFQIYYIYSRALAN